jgi:hypothetical protein
VSAFYTSARERAASAAARTACRALARAKHVTVEARFDGGWHEIVLTCPNGFRFEPDLHERIVANAGAVTDGLWAGALAALQSEQVEPCTDPDCEWCER